MAPRLVGVLGGMGSEATCRFFASVIENTAAECDQEHVPLAILNWTVVPDRTAAIRAGRHREVLDALLAGLALVERLEPALVAMPCVSAHYFHEQLAASASAPFLDIVGETAARAAALVPSGSRLGLLATTLTSEQRLFDDAFAARGLELVRPDERLQAQSVMKAIYLVKSGDKASARSVIASALQQLIDSGVDAIVTGCTDLPLVFQGRETSVPLVDALESLARAVVREAAA